MAEPPISFYPGPSQVWAAVPQYVQEAYEAGILSINHRSPQFEELAQKTKHLLHTRLSLPADYWVFYISSATEAWEILAQSLLKRRSWHFFNGAFGKKAYHYAQKLRPDAEVIAQAFPLNSLPQLPEKVEASDLIYFTHNETSNGTYLPSAILQEARQKYPEAIISLDATSSLGGIGLPWQALDVVYASVQKCLGLPAGMALFICSPAAIAQAEAFGLSTYYNNLISLRDNMQEWQTTHTPNVLNIYLLMRSLEASPQIVQTEHKIRQRAAKYYQFFEESLFQPLVSKPAYRSPTVLTLQGEEFLIDRFKKEASKQNIILGNGYGDWKARSFRLANFPAIADHHFKLLEDFTTNFPS